MARRLGDLRMSEETFTRKRCRKWECPAPGTHYIFEPGNVHALAVYCQEHADEWGAECRSVPREEFDRDCFEVWRNGRPKTGSTA